MVSGSKALTQPAEARPAQASNWHWSTQGLGHMLNTISALQNCNYQTYAGHDLKSCEEQQVLNMRWTWFSLSHGQPVFSIVRKVFFKILVGIPHACVQLVVSTVTTPSGLLGGVVDWSCSFHLLWWIACAFLRRRFVLQRAPVVTIGPIVSVCFRLWVFISTSCMCEYAVLACLCLCSLYWFVCISVSMCLP